MSHKFLLNASFHSLLERIDHDIANEISTSPCGFCGGALHVANYPRSPHGVPAKFRSQYESRLSFSCADCRKRTTPPTVRFFGRYWYVSSVLILVSALRHGASKRRISQLKAHFGIHVPKSTWMRWRRWWREVFETTPFWHKNRALMPALLQRHSLFLPRELWLFFPGSFDKKMHSLLSFLAPLTAGPLRAI